MTLKPVQNLPVPSLQNWIHSGQAPLTKKYLSQSATIAKLILDDSKTWSEAYEALSNEDRERIAAGGAMTVVASALTARFAPKAFGFLIALPAAFFSGNHAAQAASLKNWGKELKGALPQIQKELITLKPEEKEKIVSLFKKQLNFLQEAETRKNTDFSRKRTIAYSSAAWSAGSLTGMTGLSSLGILIGGITAIRWAMDEGKKTIQDPKIAAKCMQAEIQEIIGKG